MGLNAAGAADLMSRGEPAWIGRGCDVRSRCPRHVPRVRLPLRVLVLGVLLAGIIKARAGQQGRGDPERGEDDAEQREPEMGMRGHGKTAPIGEREVRAGEWPSGR